MSLTSIIACLGEKWERGHELDNRGWRWAWSRPRQTERHSVTCSFLRNTQGLQEKQDSIRSWGDTRTRTLSYTLKLGYEKRGEVILIVYNTYCVFQCQEEGSETSQMRCFQGFLSVESKFKIIITRQRNYDNNVEPQLMRDRGREL